MLLDDALQRPCAIRGVITAIGQPCAGAVIERDCHLAVDEQRAQPFHLDIDDPRHVTALQPVEQDHLIETVQKLRPEARANGPHDIFTNFFGVTALLLGHEILRAEVRGHDDQRIFEVDGPPMTVGQAAIVQHLQQDVENVRVRLFDLVEQDDLIRPPPDGFGQHAALFVADVSWRRADQPGHRVLLHKLTHVDAYHRGIVIEQERGQRFGQLCLTDAGGAEKQERADRPVRVLQPSAGAANGGRHGGDRFLLAHDALAQRLLHLEQLVAFALEHPVDRHARPTRHDTGNVVGRHGLFEHRCAAIAAFERDELAFGIGD